MLFVKLYTIFVKKWNKASNKKAHQNLARKKLVEHGTVESWLEAHHDFISLQILTILSKYLTTEIV